MWLSLSLIFCFSFQASFCYALIASLPSRKRGLLTQTITTFAVWKELFIRDNFMSCWPVNRLMVLGSGTHWSNQLWQGWDSIFLLGGIFECGRYWMICPLEEFFSNLTIMYWPTMGRNGFSLSSVWKGKSKRSPKGKGQNALFTFEAGIVR